MVTTHIAKVDDMQGLTSFEVAGLSVLASVTFLEQADCNQDGVVDFLDIGPFIGILAAQ